MSAEEVEHIMHIMYAAVHNGHPYAEDYYYQVPPGLQGPLFIISHTVLNIHDKY